MGSTIEIEHDNINELYLYDQCVHRKFSKLKFDTHVQ